MTQKKISLYIDGENLRHYLKSVLQSEGLDVDKPGLENFNYADLFSKILKGTIPTVQNFYSAKLKQHKDSPTKSQELIRKQRILKSKLQNTGFNFIISGNVRGNEITIGGKKKVVFKEKGVDVKIGVDLVSDACDGKVTTAILCSSDSDLQPAISELKKRGVETIYIGFESKPNKGLSYTCDRTILIRNSEVVDSYH